MKLWKRKSAFTLIELLVVIGIIGILAAILLPAIKAALEKANKAQAKSEATGIANALKAYYMEYSKYPTPTIGAAYPAGDTTAGLVGSSVTVNNKDIVSQLISNNTRKISFLEVSPASLDANGNFIDPWDKQYGICVDYTFDNSLDPVPSSNPPGTLGGYGAAAWSGGPNGTAGDADDVYSWK